MRAVNGSLATPPERVEKNEARLDRREQLGEERNESLLCSRNARTLGKRHAAHPIPEKRMKGVFVR